MRQTPIDSFKHDGFLLLPSLFDTALMAAFRAEYRRLKERSLYRPGSRESLWMHNLVETAPDITMRALNRENLLTLLEAIMGPFVQIDSFVLAGFPSVDACHRGEVAAWHRDRLFGEFVLDGHYTRPHSLILMTYLTDLTPETGPLRIIPGSHKHREVVPAGSANLPHSDERLLCTGEGDAILFHDGMLHSGTANVSGADRCFFGVTFNMTWMRQEDNFSGPNCQRLAQAAEQTRDYRLLRLLGVDPKQHRRLNSGLVPPSENAWARWAREDTPSTAMPDRGAARSSPGPD